MDQPGNHILFRGNQPAAADRMRELLARTVQDQFADQRSNAGAIDDIRQRMEGLEWLVKEVREQEIPGMAAQLYGLARQFEESTQQPPRWAESLAEHIEVLRAQVAPGGRAALAVGRPRQRLGERRARPAPAAGGLQHRRPGLGGTAGAGRPAGQAAPEREQATAEHGVGGGPVRPAGQGRRRARAADRPAGQGALGGQGARRDELQRAGGPGGPERGDHHAPAHPVDGRDDGHGRRPVGQRGGRRQPGRPARRPGPGGARPDRAAR